MTQDTPPRHCPTCGAMITAPTDSTCSVCGARLSREEAPHLDSSTASDAVYRRPLSRDGLITASDTHIHLDGAAIPLSDIQSVKVVKNVPSYRRPVLFALLALVPVFIIGLLADHSASPDTADSLIPGLLLVTGALASLSIYFLITTRRSTYSVFIHTADATVHGPPRPTANAAEREQAAIAALSHTPLP